MKAKRTWTDKPPHYSMCFKCAAKQGGKMPKGHVCTVTFGKCLYCKTKDVTLIPWVDFDWQGRRTVHLRD